MNANVGLNPGMAEQDRRIADAFSRERSRLTGFIRQRVPEPADVEDILQDVFSELIEASRLPTPIEHLGAWLFNVARNRITDLFRRNRTRSAPEGSSPGGLRGGGGHRGHRRHRMAERWESMSEEERPKARESMRGRCGPRRRQSTAEPAASGA